MEETKAKELGTSLLVPSVQELAKETLIAVPPRYLRKNQALSKATSTCEMLQSQIPVIDFQALFADANIRDLELERLDRACKDLGFFQTVAKDIITLRGSGAIVSEFFVAGIWETAKGCFGYNEQKLTAEILERHMSSTYKRVAATNDSSSVCTCKTIRIIGGCALSAATELNFNMTGFVGAMISNLAFVFRNIFSKKGMKGQAVSGMNYYACLSMMSVDSYTVCDCYRGTSAMGCWLAESSLSNWTQFRMHRKHNEAYFRHSFLDHHLPYSCPTNQRPRSCHCNSRHLSLFTGKAVKKRDILRNVYLTVNEGDSSLGRT
ncbi:hypothetical protein ACFE04_020735 [Oxalis oulophora]